MQRMQATVWLTIDVLQFCQREADHAVPRETGGVLMGWHRQERAEIVIVHAVGPGPGSIHRSNRFDPDNEHHIAEIGDVYQRSGRKVTYLGDWHTHPFGSTGPSRVDRRTLAKIAEHDESRCPEPVLLILAGNRVDGWEPASHVWAPRPLFLWELPGSEIRPLRTWKPGPGELDSIAYPYR